MHLPLTTVRKKLRKKEITLDDPNIDDVIGMYHRQDLFDDIELLDGAGDDFDLEAVRRGELYTRILWLGSYKLRRRAVP